MYYTNDAFDRMIPFLSVFPKIILLRAIISKTDHSFSQLLVTTIALESKVLRLSIVKKRSPTRLFRSYLFRKKENAETIMKFPSYF